MSRLEASQLVSAAVKPSERCFRTVDAMMQFRDGHPPVLVEDFGACSQIVWYRPRSWLSRRNGEDLKRKHSGNIPTHTGNLVTFRIK